MKGSALLIFADISLQAPTWREQAGGISSITKNRSKRNHGNVASWIPRSVPGRKSRYSFIFSQLVIYSTSSSWFFHSVQDTVLDSKSTKNFLNPLPHCYLLTTTYLPVPLKSMPIPYFLLPRCLFLPVILCTSYICLYFFSHWNSAYPHMFWQILYIHVSHLLLKYKSHLIVILSTHG